MMKLLRGTTLCAVLAVVLPAHTLAQRPADAASCPQPETALPFNASEMLRRELGKLEPEREWARGGNPPRGAPLAEVDLDTARARYLRANAAYRVATAHLRRGCRFVPNLILAVSATPSDSVASTEVLMVDVVYYYTGDHGSEVSIGAITLLDGQSTGYWAFRPVRLIRGLHTARIRLGMADTGRDAYPSDAVKVMMYVHRAQNFVEHIIPLEHGWLRER